MEQQNVFQNMNQDLSKIRVPANMYYEAFNFRPATDKGLTDGALENIRGTLDLTTIPNLDAVQQISIISGIYGAIGFIFTNNGVPIVSAGTYNVTSTTTSEDIYNFLITDANLASSFGVLYNIYFNESYLLVMPLNTLGTVITPTGVAAISINSNYVPAQSGLEVIGSTYINNDIYLLTTNVKSQAPTNGVGQIWKLVVNNVNNTLTSLTLIYNNYVNFSTYNAIAPSAILGRYENSGIQRIYWTDFYNKLRSLNVADPQAFALDLSLLDVQPSVDFDIPILTNISSAPGTAVVDIGCYQLSYRLSNTGGSISTYSLPSNIVFVVTGAEENQTGGLLWKDYHGDVVGTTTTKRITWTVDNIDRQFDRIEAVVLFRETKDEVPLIIKIYEGPVSSDSIDIILDGDILNSPDSTTVSLEEYLALSNVFTHCKTITTKDNRLVVGNVRNEFSELDFDARAYRFAISSNDLKIVENSASTTYTINTSTDYLLIDEESDAIAVANIETTDPTNYDNNYRYKRNSTTLGGEGPNISYEFISIAVAADKTVEPVNPQPLPIVSTNPDYSGVSSYNLQVNSSDNNGTDVLQEYPITFPSLINDGMKYPQMNSIYWGNQQNEVYRYAIQFYDKSKNPYFAEWIGDIKFPDYFDPCPIANNIYADGTPTGFTDYRKSFTTVAGTHGSNEVYVCQLGLKLTVNIPALLTSKISGYSIVRVKREEADKRVVAEGLITNTFMNTVPNFYYLADEEMDYNYAGVGFADYGSISFVTPNILDSSLSIPAAGMKLRISSYFEAANALRNVDIQTGASVGSRNKLLKMYDQVQDVAYEANINYAKLLGLDGNTTYLGRTFLNYSGYTSTHGNPSYLLILNGVGISVPLPNTTDKYFGYIYNPIINQYGGNTYTDRANNEYIICSHFRSIKTNTTGYADTSYIFGGDVTNDIMDEERITPGLGTVGAARQSTTFFFPASSPVNRFLRHGRHANVTLDTVTVSVERTDYFYNKVYSTQNDIIKFFPKPDPFISNEEYVNRFYISEIKINGELSDAWSVFKSLNYWDVEGSYGSINGVMALQDEVYFIQDKAFGKLLINPKTAVTSTSGEEIQIGRGNVIDSHDYVSVETGSIHQFSFLKSGYSLYFVDARHNKIYQFSQNRPLNPESDIKGMHSWLINNLTGNLETTDKPVYADVNNGINGIHGVYDYVNNELIYTFRRGQNLAPEQSLTTPYTLVYSEKLNAFTAFYTHFPKNYITNNRVIISANPTSLQSLYLHNEGEYGKFYGVYHDSSISFFSNKQPNITKTFDLLEFQTEVQNGTTLVDTASGATPVQETFNRLEVNTDYQSNNVALNSSNTKRRYRTWKTEIPRNSVKGEYVSAGFFSRMRDKYLKLKLSFTNNGNKRFILHDAIVYFRNHLPK